MSDDIPPTRESKRYGSRSWLSSEAAVGILTLLLGPIGGGVVWLISRASVTEDHVSQLMKDRDSSAIEMRAIETQAATDRASADKRETMIEAGFKDISGRLDNIQTAVNNLQDQADQKGHHR